MTTIKNKQTGETLTGEVTQDYRGAFDFRISGCKDRNFLVDAEWEILPPPLPTGIGAVVTTKEAKHNQTRVNGMYWVFSASQKASKTAGIRVRWACFTGSRLRIGW